MCYYINTKYDTAIAKKIFGLSEADSKIQQVEELSAFAHPKVGVIADRYSATLQTGIWGLMPEGYAPEFINKNYTLNARQETLDEKVSFQKYVNNRCVIPINSFYEWRWETPSGSKKRKFQIWLENEQVAALAAIYSIWESPKGIEFLTFTVLTTQANAIMEHIHNTKKRMPIVLHPKQVKAYLSETPLQEFAYPSWDPKFVTSGDKHIPSLF